MIIKDQRISETTPTIEADESCPPAEAAEIDSLNA
jgi:hypothetical protein